MRPAVTSVVFPFGPVGSVAVAPLLELRLELGDLCVSCGDLLSEVGNRVGHRGEGLTVCGGCCGDLDRVRVEGGGDGVRRHGGVEKGKIGIWNSEFGILELGILKFGIWNLKFGIRIRELESGIWNSELFGIWNYLEFGIRNLECGI